MNNISKCPGKNCPVKEKCVRFTISPDAMSVWTDFKYTIPMCLYIIPNQELTGQELDAYLKTR